jgi:hypothetical protein
MYSLMFSFRKIYIYNPKKGLQWGDEAVETVMLVATPSFTTLLHTFSTKIVGKPLTAFTETMKPKLTAPEVCHRLAPSVEIKMN